MYTLKDFGWTNEFQGKLQKLGPESMQSLQPARVVADFGTSLKIALPEVCSAELSGKLAHYSGHDGARQVPKVGDWVAVHLSDGGDAVIETILPRRSEIARKAAGHKTVRQVIAANVDVAFVMLAMDSDFSVARLKRYLYQLSVAHIDAVIVLNKADKTDDINEYIKQLRSLGLPIVVGSAISMSEAESGVDEILRHIQPGQTAILLGSSGVGKSTLTNRLLGRKVQSTQAIRASDSTGKHTTVHRELFVLPNGGLLIDTPGIRELQLWGTEGELDENFDDVAALVSQCKYSTCQHGSEPGCAIRQALSDGTLLAMHYASYLKMKTELAGLKQKTDVLKQRNNMKSLKNIRRQNRDTLDEIRQDMD